MKTLSKIGAVLALIASFVVSATLIAMAAVAVPFALSDPRHATFAAGIFQKLPAFNNVVANGIATCDMATVLGQTLDRIQLVLGGGSLTQAMLTNIRVLANEKPIFEDSGARISTTQAYLGITDNAAYLSLDFNNILAGSNMDKQAGAIDTLSAGLKKLSMEVTIAGATTPTLYANAQLSKAPMTTRSKLYNGLIGKRFNRTQSFAASGEFLMALNLARSTGTFIKRVHLFGSTVTAARVTKTDLQNVKREIFNSVDADNDRVQVEYKRVPQSNCFTIDFCADGDIKKALPIGDALAMEWFVTVSGSGNVVLVPEFLDLLANN